MSVTHDSSIKSHTKLTYEHYSQFPDDGNRHEIIAGKHYINPAPVPYHQQLSAAISFQLYAAISESGNGDVYSAPIDVQFSSHDVVEPDIVVVLKTNNIITETRLQGAPDLVVEILLPSTSSRDEGLKKELYEQAGVPEYWIVAPREKVVRKYSMATGAYGASQQHADTITFDGLSGVTVDLTRIW